MGNKITLEDVSAVRYALQYYQELLISNLQETNDFDLKQIKTLSVKFEKSEQRAMERNERVNIELPGDYSDVKNWRTEQLKIRDLNYINDALKAYLSYLKNLLENNDEGLDEFELEDYMDDYKIYRNLYNRFYHYESNAQEKFERDGDLPPLNLN